MGLMRSSPRHGRTAGRAGAFVAVVGLHVVAVAGLLHMRYSERIKPEPAIQVVSLSMDQPAEEAPPAPKVELMEPPPVDVVVPLVTIDIAQPMTAITPPPPQRAQPVRQLQPVSLGEPAPLMLRDDELDYLDAPPPRYPRAAKQARVQGTVLLWVLIDGEGRPREVRVHQSSGHEQLDQEGRQAVMGWRFRPHRRDGVAQTVQAIIPVHFKLNHTRRG